MIIQTLKLLVAITVTLAGVTKAPLLDSLVIEYALNARTIANFTLFDEPGTYRPVTGSDVAVWDAATKIYGGSVDQVNKVLVRPNNSPIKHEILSVGFERWLDKRLTFDVNTNQVPVWKSYASVVDAGPTTLAWVSGDYFDTELAGKAVMVGGNPRTVLSVQSPVALTLGESSGAGTAVAFAFTWTAGAIVRDLIARYGTEEGITAGTIDTGADVAKLVGDYRIVSDVVDELAKLSGYISWIDADKALFFVARPTVVAPFNITDSSKVKDLGIRDTRESYRNMVALRANFQAFGVTPESFTGDSTARAWQLGNRIAAVDSMDVGGSPVSFGVYGIDTGKDFYFGIGERIVSQDAVGTVLAPTDVLTVNYRALGSDVVVASTPGSEIIARGAIESGTSGRYQVFVDDSQNPDAAGALAKAQSSVDRNKIMPAEIKYRTCQALEPLAPLLRPGQLQTIGVTRLGVGSASYLITKVRAVMAKALTVGDEDGGSHRVLWYEVTAATGTAVNNFLSAFESFVGAGGGGIAASSSGVPGPPGGNPTPAGNITLGVVTQQITPDGVRISIAYEPPSPLGSYLGFYPYLQAGDYLVAGAAPGAELQPDGLGFVLDTSVLAPPQSPEPLPYVPYDPDNKILSFVRPFPLETKTWIAYGVSRTSQVTSQLITLDKAEPPAHSPHAIFEVRPKADPPDVRSGAEVAPLALSFVLADQQYYPQDDGSYHWAVKLAWTNAGSDPRYSDLGGYDVLKVALTDGAEGDIEVVQAGVSKDDLYIIHEHSTPAVPTVYRFYLVSWRSVDGAKNSIIYGTTPWVDVTVAPPVGAGGTEFTSLVTGLAINTSVGYVYDATGQIASYHILISWLDPADPTFGAVVLHLIRGDLIDRVLTGAETTSPVTFELAGFLDTPEPMRIYALSANKSLDVNTYVPGITPAVDFIVNPPGVFSSGAEYCDNVTPASTFVALGAALPQVDGTYVQPCTVDATPPDDSKWGSCDIEVKYVDGSSLVWATNVRTFPFRFNYKPTPTVQNATFYVVSRDVNGRRNAIVDGTTPRQVVSQGTGAGQLDFAKALGASLATYFDVVGGQLVVKNLGIDTALLANLAITTGKMADLAVDNTKLAALSVDAAKLANSAVTATKIANLAVGTAAIALLAVGNAQIADLAVTNAKVNDLAATKITAGTLVAGVIYTGTVNANAINAGTMSAVNMSGGTLTLNLNGVTSIIDNVFNSLFGKYVGFKSKLNSTGAYCLAMYDEFALVSAAGNGVMQILNFGAYSGLYMGSDSGGNQITLDAPVDNPAIVVSSATGSVKMISNNTNGPAFVASGNIGITGSQVVITFVNFSTPSVNSKTFFYAGGIIYAVT